jgi:hypothetical protein
MSGDIPSPANSEPAHVEFNREILRICDDIERAVELYAAYLVMGEVIERTVSRAIDSTKFTDKPLKLRVEIPEDYGAYVTKDDKVVLVNPTEYVVNELREITPQGVSFYNSETDEWLRIEGHHIKVTPDIDLPDLEA